MFALLLIKFLIPINSMAFMGAPGTCGSSCMANWGRPMYPSAYYYPNYINPYAFYSNPYAYYPMLPAWYGGVMTPQYLRGVQSVGKPVILEKSVDK